MTPGWEGENAQRKCSKEKKRKGKDKGVKIKEKEIERNGGSMLDVVNLSLALGGERRGPCPDLWLPAGVIREWIGSFSIAPFTTL